MNSSGSLKTRLIGGVLALVSLIWLVVAIFAWFETRHETEEILDAHLAQAAGLLSSFANGEIDELEEHLPTHRYLRKVTFQVWEKGEKLRVHSANAPAQRLSQKEDGYADSDFDGKRWRVYSLWNGKYLVQVGETFEARDSISRELASHLLAPMVVALPLLALTLALLIGHGLRPLSRIAEDISQRDARRLDPIDSKDAPSEMQPVLERLNQLLARLDQSIEQERRFTADAAHELRTPLAAMRTHAQVAQGATDATARNESLGHVIEATDRATHLVEQLLTLARLDAAAISGTFAPCDLHHIAAEAVALAAPAAIAKDIDLELGDGLPIQVPGQAALLSVLLRNLINNAVRYSPPKVGVGVTAGTLADGRAYVDVVDAGPGIAPEERARVLDRFYRVAGSDASGSGLGLSIAARIAELHGARLELAEGPNGKGLRARVVFAPTPTA